MALRLLCRLLAARSEALRADGLWFTESGSVLAGIRPRAGEPRKHGCGWHLSLCSDLTGSEPPGLQSNASLIRRSLSSPDCVFILPHAVGESRDAGVLPNALIHRHSGKRLAQYAVVNGPAASPNTPHRLRLPEDRRAIEFRWQIAVWRKAGVEALHPTFSLLIGKPVSLKHNGVVVLQRLDEI